MKNIFRLIFASTLLLSSSLLYGQDKKIFNCGVATGFPPYQYVDKNGRPAGLDIEVAELVFKTAGLKVQFIQDNWENLLFNLIHKQKSVDMLCGAEVSPERQKRLAFSTPYFKRRTVMFVLKNGPIKNLSDLFGQIVAGDLHSSFEKILGSRAAKIRITKTSSKEESFQRLKDKSVMAVIAPLEVGMFLAQKLNISVQIFDEHDPGTEVSIAIKKGDYETLSLLNSAILKLIENGEIKKIIKKHQVRAKPSLVPRTQSDPLQNGFETLALK